MQDYPFFADCSLADRLRCVAVEAEALGLPSPMLIAIREAAERLDEGTLEDRLSTSAAT